MNKFFGLIAFFLLAIISACNFFPAVESQYTTYYDLKSPVPIASCVPIDVKVFSTMTGDRFRIVYRKDDIQITGIESCKWVQTPGPLMTRYLRLAFRTTNIAINKAQPYIELKGEILAFEINRDKANLGVCYTLVCNNKEFKRTVLISTPIKEKTADAAVQALSQSAEKFAQMIANEAKQLAGKK